MKKRLLFAALALMCAAGTYAFEVGEYVYTQTQRLKITGENKIVNGDFSDMFTGWTSADAENPDIDQETTWNVEPAVGPNGENAVKSIAATQGAALCKLVAGLEGGTYVVSFQIKGTGENSTSIGVQNTNNSTVNHYANEADIFVNTDASLNRAFSTDEAPVVGVAGKRAFAEEWTTVNFAFTIEEGQFLVIHLERMAADVMMTNFMVQPAEEVYDIRAMQNRLAFAKKLLDDPNFNIAEAQEAHDNLTNQVIPAIEGAIEVNQMDDQTTAEGMLEGFEEAFAEYLNATTENLANDEYFKYAGDLTAFPKYNRGQISEGQIIGGFMFNGANWLHAQGADMLTKQIQGTYDNGDGSVSLYNTQLPAGKYYIAAEMRNSYCDKDYNLTFNLEAAVKAFIGPNEVELGTIKGEDFVKFYYVADYDASEPFKAGFYWAGINTGSNFQIKNFEIRSFGNVADIVAHIKAWDTFKAQWDAAESARSTIEGMIGSKDYPWGQDVLKNAQTEFDPFYNDIVSKGWVNAEGKDAGVASTEELTDWASFQGGEVPEDGKATYQLVRGYQAAINAVKELNKPLTDLAADIEAAEAVMNDGMNVNGDKVAFADAIDVAKGELNEVLASTTDATREADSTKVAATAETLAAAVEMFKQSAKLIPFVDIDFSNDFEEDVDAGTFTINGAAGKMVFTSVNKENNMAEEVTYMRGYGEDFTDILRVGKGAAVVELPETITDDDVLRVQFDMWIGGLINRNLIIELQNDADERVAGFSYCLYGGTTAYNDFDNEEHTGLNIAVCGKSTAKNGDAALVTDGFKWSFDLVLDFKAQTVQGLLPVSPTGAHTGGVLPMPVLENNKPVKFVLNSSYDNTNRRCWFDNLKIFKYASSADAGISAVSISDAPSAVYNLQGVKVAADAKNLKKGIYVSKGKKFVVK